MNITFFNYKKVFQKKYMAFKSKTKNGILYMQQ